MKENKLIHLTSAYQRPGESLYVAADKIVLIQRVPARMMLDQQWPELTMVLVGQQYLYVEQRPVEIYQLIDETLRSEV